MSLGTGIFKVTEYRRERFVICEDEKGKFVFSEDETELIPIEPQFKKLCFLTSTRRRLPQRVGRA